MQVVTEENAGCRSRTQQAGAGERVGSRALALCVKQPRFPRKGQTSSYRARRKERYLWVLVVVCRAEWLAVEMEEVVCVCLCIR